MPWISFDRRLLSIPDNDAYLQARRLTVWHYQWMILHEFLPHIVPQPVIDDVLTNGRHFYDPLHGEAFIPVEFQIAYRFGHSMVRPSYRANLHGDNGQPFFGMIFDPAEEGTADPVDLRGFAELRGALSGGKLSLISAALSVPMCGRTKESIQRFRRLSSSFLWRRYPAGRHRSR